MESAARGGASGALAGEAHRWGPLAQRAREPAATSAAAGGLVIPPVWNCGGYEGIQPPRLLEGIVDWYLPDVKFADPGPARRAGLHRGIR